jgi:UDP-2,3-diacylglucosamine pyrophosphatase LpxH
MTFSREGASDNYDSAIYFFLKGLFKDTPRISFLDATNPNEMLVNIYGMHILLTHGASISDNVERSVAQVQGKWAAIGHRVDYVLFGHIHAARIGDTHARSGSLCGSNSYNEERLNLRGRASQNMFIVSPGSIEGIRLDLQVIDYPRQYQFDPDLATYNPKSHDKATATTEVVRIVI